MALWLIFLLTATFYLWIAATTYPLSLHGQQADPYNRLATAFLHLHLSVGHAPAGLLSLSEPYNPAQNASFQGGANANLHDLALYHGNLFLTWGPVPALTLLAPMHLLGLEPSSSIATALFAIVGFGFVLLTLRILLRQLDNRSLWMGLLAALSLSLSSAVPFILRRPAAYEEAIACGFCFAMAGIWLAMAALAHRRASLRRLLMMSLCIGLAAGSRPTLAPIALILVPVYMALKATRPHRETLIALVLPIGVCLLLLMAYNQARFGSPLEIGAKYQLAGYDPQTTRLANPRHVPPGVWFYALSPPRLKILFPFIELTPPPITYPASLPADYAPEVTGGLLPMTPIVIFLAALPWIWRRRPTLLGSLAVPLLLLAGAGVAALLFLSYEFPSSTERYEVDFSTLFLLGALTAWIALSNEMGRHYRKLMQTGGALLVLWGCFTGAAISFVGYFNLLAIDHTKTWTKLEAIGSPISRLMADIVGHPVLASLLTADIIESHVRYTSLGVGDVSFALSANEKASFAVVSPNNRTVTLTAHVTPNPALGIKPRYGMVVGYSGKSSYSQWLPPLGGSIQIPLKVNSGITHFSLRPLPVSSTKVGRVFPASALVFLLSNLSLAGHERLR